MFEKRSNNTCICKHRPFTDPGCPLHDLTTMGFNTCDCHLHDNQVCDICQGVKDGVNKPPLHHANTLLGPRQIRTQGDYHQTAVWQTGTGQIIHNMHPDQECEGRPCVVHNPSDHHMRDWPTHLRTEDSGVFTERICGHGVGHPDPDDPFAPSVHGCDGCCKEPETGLEGRKSAALTDEETGNAADLRFSKKEDVVYIERVSCFRPGCSVPAPPNDLSYDWCSAHWPEGIAKPASPDKSAQNEESRPHAEPDLQADCPEAECRYPDCGCLPGRQQGEPWTPKELTDAYVPDETNRKIKAERDALRGQLDRQVEITLNIEQINDSLRKAISNYVNADPADDQEYPLRWQQLKDALHE